MDYLVTHIIPDGSDPGRRIDAVYGPLCGLVYEDQAIRHIEHFVNSYYTYAGGIRANVYVVRRAFSAPFLTTSPDGYGPNNLCQLLRYSG